MKKRWLTIIPILGMFCVGAVLLILPPLRKAERVLNHERLDVQESTTVAFRAVAFTLAPGLDTKLYTGPSEFRGICEFEGKIYAATAAGLQIFSPNGNLLEHWTSAEGLPSLDLTSVAVHEGSLWIGTSDAGFLQYDGENWRHLVPDGKFWRSVTRLHSTPQGTLFAGTAGGLLAYETTHFRRLFPDRLQGATVTAIKGDAGHLWVGTFQDGLFLLSGGTLTPYGRDQELPDKLITDLEVNRDTAFVSTSSGIHEIRNGRIRRLEKNRFVTSLAWAGDGLWFSTQSGQIRHSKHQTSGIQPPGPVEEPPQSKSVRLERIGTSVAVMEEDAVGILRNGRIEDWIHRDSSLSASNVSSLLRADDGNLWVGYFDEGVDVLSPDLELQRHLRDETMFCINHLAQDSASRIYVSTANGLAVIQPDGLLRVYREKDGLLSDRVQQALPLDHEGRRVAVATAQGLTLKEEDSMKSLFVFHGLVNNHVYTLASDSERLYLGTLGGMNRIEKMLVTGTWTEADSGLKRNWINALTSINNTVYIGTYGSGIQALTRSGEWLPMEGLPEDLEINPNAFYHDGRFLFCGTLDRGFYFMDLTTGKWKHFSSFLPVQNITSFASDRRFLYAGTTRGIMRIRYEVLHRTPDLS